MKKADKSPEKLTFVPPGADAAFAGLRKAASQIVRENAPANAKLGRARSAVPQP